MSTPYDADDLSGTDVVARCQCGHLEQSEMFGNLLRCGAKCEASAHGVSGDYESPGEAKGRQTWTSCSVFFIVFPGHRTDRGKPVAPLEKASKRV